MEMDKVVTLDPFTFFRFFVSDSIFSYNGERVRVLNVIKYLFFIIIFGLWLQYSLQFANSEAIKIDQIKRIAMFEIPFSESEFGSIEVSLPAHVIMYFNKKNLDENTEKYMKANSNAI